MVDPSSAPAAPDYGPPATLRRLRALFPRGRFTKQADGAPILVARSKALSGCHVYEQAPGEGILHVAWCPEAATRLQVFSRGRRGGAGRPFRPPESGENDPRNDARRADGSGRRDTPRDGPGGAPTPADRTTATRPARRELAVETTPTTRPPARRAGPSRSAGAA
jgi:hypothetical protein